MSDKNKYIEVTKMFSLISQLGIMMLIPIFGCAFLGKFLDGKFNTDPILFLIFLVLGVGGAFMGVYKTLIVYTKRK
ncbi:AtpZ/AtpI family protein [Romboutsia weinsteinii]|uniref:AtpZ/AtpI family protein n=1 Tax=Romboutsia weinsteinii TaxID=2020949 RepID=A0A371J097_9FIRM|nr:AtpZ/AtpI family protein [Romboutsia weinsteinii]RDY26097.1 AtpZ/AtpI family protein [Romboutsia weinsteinii]